MEFRIKSTGLKAFVEHLERTNQAHRIDEDWGLNGDLDILDTEIPRFIVWKIDETLEILLDDYFAVDHKSSYHGIKSPLIISEIENMAKQVNEKFDNEEGQNTLLKVFGDFDEVLPEDFCNLLKRIVVSVCKNYDFDMSDYIYYER